jgi:hypothetical protein
MNESKGYWSSVFYQATMLMKSRPQLGGETAFWMARNMVDQNIDSDGGHGGAPLPLAVGMPQRVELVLAP